jgi:hypothetical protein
MVRSSAWHLSLSKPQQEYAMLDASIALQIYRKVQTRTAYDVCLKDQPEAVHGTAVLCTTFSPDPGAAPQAKVLKRSKRPRKARGTRKMPRLWQL